MRQVFVIDGDKFDDLAGFYDEFERIFTKDMTWRIGRGLDAVNDVLRGGFGRHEMYEPIDIVWRNFAKSRRDLGYPATVIYYEEMLRRCHPTNREDVLARLREAENGQGDTVLDRILSVITAGGDSGHDCSLQCIE